MRQGTRSRVEPPSGVRRPCPVQRLGWPMRSGVSGVARLDALPHVWRRWGRAPARSRPQASDGRVPCSALDGRCAPARPALHASMRFRTCGADRDALPRGAVVRLRWPCPVQRFGWSMRSGASGVARLDPPFVVLYSALSIIAPSVNVLPRTRRKPSTIRGAAPDVLIGQSAAARAGARPYQTRGWKLYLVCELEANCSSSTRKTGAGRTKLPTD